MTRASDTAKLLGAGATILDGTTISTADNTDSLTLQSTDADANVGPVMLFKRDSSSPAASDFLGYTKYSGENNADEETIYAQTFSQIVDVTNGSEDGTFAIDTMVAGTLRARVEVAPTETVFNEDSVDVDFRVESNGDANMLFVDGGNDRIGIGTNSPQKLLHLKDGDIVVGNGTASNNAVIGRVGFSTDSSNSRFIGMESFRGGDAANGDLRFHTFGGDSDSGERLRIDTAGRIGIGVVPTAQFSHNILQVGHQATLGANASLSTTGQTYLTHNLYYNTDGNLRVFNTSSANEGAILQMVDGIFKFSNSSATTGTPTVNERMRIQSSDGNVHIGHTSNFNFGTGTANGVTFAPAGAVVASRSGDSPVFLQRTSSDGSIVHFYRDTTVVGTISVNGSNTAYNTSSDYRLKENLEYSFDATSRLKQLKPCRFNFKTDADTTVDGFIAHEVSSVVPEAISGEKDAMTEEVLYVDGDEIPDGKKVGDVKEASVIDPQGIDQSKLVPLLVKTIQELEARITTLENA